MLGNDRGMAVEYLILAVLVSLGSLFVVYRYGRAVRGRVDTAGERVANVSSADTQGSTDARATNQPALVEASAPPPSQAGAAAGEGSVDVLGFRLSLPTLIWLGILIVVIGMLMVMRMKRGAKSASKAGSQYAELAKRVRGDGGQAMLEFFLAMLIGVMMILGIIQVALMFNAKSMVKLAAFNAARAAIVARDAADPTRGVQLAEMQKKARLAAKMTLLPVIPAMHGRLPGSLTPKSVAQFMETNLGLGAGGQPDTSSLQGIGGAAAGLAFEFVGKTIDDDFKLVDCIDVQFVNPTDPNAVPAKIEQWPAIEFDDPGRARENVIKVMVTWHYPLVVPFVNRIFTALAHPKLYRLALALVRDPFANPANGPAPIGSVNAFGNLDDIQPWAHGFALSQLAAGSVFGVAVPNGLSAIVQSVGEYILFRVPIRETYVMRMQWDRRP